MILHSTLDWYFLALAVFVTWAISYSLAYLQRGKGSDQSVHFFFINNIRAAGHRLTSRVDRLLNPSFYAYPLLLHWALSFTKERTILLVSQLLNPVCGALLLVLVFFGVQNSGVDLHPGICVLLLALTPQFFHAHNARNFGLSARSVGIVLFFAFGQLSFLVTNFSYVTLGAAVFVGYLIWNTNKFAIQAAVICGAVLGLLFANWKFLGLFGLSFVFFAILHRRYALEFLQHYVIYINFYRTELAAKFILKWRYSIWRDLVYDIPVKLIKSLKDGVKYAYGNSFLIVVLLNPLFVAAVVLGLSDGVKNEWLEWQWQLAVSGLIAAFLTSFRATRFLGEPDRYVEITSAFAVGVAVWYLSAMDAKIIWLVGAYSVVLIAIQVAITVFDARKKTENMQHVLEPVARRINENASGEEVRFASNNENFTKFLMGQPWSFVKLWSASPIYAGLKFADAFQYYPILKQEALENIVTEYRINFCYLDRTVFSDIFAASNENRARLTLIYEDAKGKLFHIRW